MDGAMDGGQPSGFRILQTGYRALLMPNWQ